MTNHIYFYRKPGTTLKLMILDVPDWEGFDKLIMFVEKYYNATVLTKYDGAIDRRYIFESNGHKLELIHDEGYGNYFIAPTEDSEKLLHEIGNDIDQRFKNLENNND